ncbi:MAG: formate dehydrogenase accessory sulfurtransferase FdhD [Ilumatobacter sp.]|uniref:formate dehydrogenase accessory sulfurtransferase FdhD n=1 Tax=Ilumatobacter sp. TaxID=1967498 RepID=UPI0026288AAF|nr:formate dehydrogenase accessory sulfurtransferase FdhD [Ilumatobacter sp.]MDJ0768686.1 formate dehydrogenase accessory sulfurtransferase FdhD [Ilumatobacter sp.]
MTRSRTRRFLVTEVTPEGARRRPDDLIVEEPMTIELDGTTVATTMRTPGHDYELAVGFCHTEGLLSGALVRGVRYCANGAASDTDFNLVTVDTGGVAPTPTPRLGTTSSSCGWCGAEQLDEMSARLDPLPDGGTMPLELLVRIPDLVTGDQTLFDSTGAVHAAAVFDRTGEVVLLREDVGRHNAVDKAVGALLLDGRLPATGLGLFVSGRASVEMVQKAWAAGLGTVVAVSAPTALAVEAARSANLTLAGFVRGGRCNVYAPERLPPPDR